MRVDEAFVYKHDVKTVVLTPSRTPGAGERDEHTFFWDGTASFRVNGDEVYKCGYDDDFVPLLSNSFMAFVLAPADVWMEKNLYRELEARKWLKTSNNWRALYRAQASI